MKFQMHLRNNQSRRIKELEGQLQSTKAALQSKDDELQNKDDELQSNKAELQSKDDELQSTKAELQSTKAELQSNKAALQSKDDELQRTKIRSDQKSEAFRVLSERFGALYNEKMVVCMKLELYKQYLNTERDEHQKSLQCNNAQLVAMPQQLQTLQKGVGQAESTNLEEAQDTSQPALEMIWSHEAASLQQEESADSSQGTYYTPNSSY